VRRCVGPRPHFAAWSAGPCSRSFMAARRPSCRSRASSGERVPPPGPLPGPSDSSSTGTTLSGKTATRIEDRAATAGPPAGDYLERPTFRPPCRPGADCWRNWHPGTGRGPKSRPQTERRGPPERTPP
jgi:hypothetical protein